MKDANKIKEELINELAELRQRITELEKSETEYQRAEGRLKIYQDMVESAHDAIFFKDLESRYIVANSRALEAFGLPREEVIGKSDYEIMPDQKEAEKNIADDQLVFETRRAIEITEHMTGANGKEYWFDAIKVPQFDDKRNVTGLIGIARDITERKQMQEQLMVTARLASIGELASGIAHELNNPLTGVIGFAQLLLNRDIADDLKKDIEVMYSEAQRAAEVVKNLLTFARKHAPVKQLVDINSIIDKVLELRAYEQRVSNIQVNTHFAPDLPEIMADYFQLQQVFLNIVINAEHFMIEAHNRGTLTITTERADDIITASFTDDGPGISKENLGHLFDPFFTTKEVGKGTGLGLSICHGVLTEHGGRIYAESELGKGATFVVELPITVDREGTVK